MTMPEGFRTITPHMTIKDASAAIAFYQKAFGAKLLYRCNMEGSDHVLHARMQVGDSVFMLNDEFPEQGALGPHPQRRSPVAVHLYVDDVDALFAQATGAGGVPAFRRRTCSGAIATPWSWTRSATPGRSPTRWRTSARRRWQNVRVKRSPRGPAKSRRVSPRAPAPAPGGRAAAETVQGVRA